VYMYIHCVSKNDTDGALYNFNSHQPILVIFLQKCWWESTLSHVCVLSYLS